MMHGTVLCTFAIYIYLEFEEIKTHFFFPTTKGSMNACIELVGFSAPKNVKNLCSKHITQNIIGQRCYNRIL